MQEKNYEGKSNSEGVGNGVSIEIYDTFRLQAEMDVLLPQLREVTTNALGKTPEDMKEVASSFTFMVAVKENGRIVGYGGYEIEENVPGVGTILDESKMVRRDTQGKGYGVIITQKAIAFHPEADYLVFTSQNPRQIQSARRALQGRQLAPIDVSYQENEQFRSVLKNIAASTGRDNIDPNTGVRRNMYFGERFGDYEFDLSDPNIAFIESRLSATGFNRDAGDGVFFIAKITSSPYETLTQSLDSIAQDTARTTAVEGEEIVHTVMGTVGIATSEIKMTMDLAEEISQPLPEAYHQLLSAKLDEGIQITRVGFGTKKDFQEIVQSHVFSSPNFKFAHNPNLQEYQRMILVDDNTLFFRYNGVFYKSTDVVLLEQFQVYFSRTLQRSLVESSPERKPSSLPEKPKDYGGIFSFRGKFPDGTRVQHNTPYGAWMTGEPDLFLEVRDEDIKDIEQLYEDEVRNLESEFELNTNNNQGLSREQNLRIHAAYIAISDFNGKPINQSSTELFSTAYRRSQTDTLRIKDFKGKGEIVCLEASAIVQQLLSRTDDVIFISGFMDLSRAGVKDVLQMGAEPHAFNLIKPSNNSEYPIYLLDIANPHTYPTADGKYFTWEPYCIPLSEGQLSILSQGSDLIIADTNGTRTYSARNGVFDS